MDKEEFHAVLKLVSGEEIFAKVCPCRKCGHSARLAKLCEILMRRFRKRRASAAAAAPLAAAAIT